MHKEIGSLYMCKGTGAKFQDNSHTLPMAFCNTKINRIISSKITKPLEVIFERPLLLNASKANICMRKQAIYSYHEFSVKT